MSHIRNLKAGICTMLVAAAIVPVTSCNNENEAEAEEIIYNQNFVQGKLNNHDIAMNDINTQVTNDKSDFRFISADQTDIPRYLDWQVELVETQDTVITMYLHIDNLKRTNEVIYSPNEKSHFKTECTCYATVKDLKNNTTTIFHPTDTKPIYVKWETFMMKYDLDTHKISKIYEYKNDFGRRRWPGIEGTLDGTLTCDDASKAPLDINIKYILL